MLFCFSSQQAKEEEHVYLVDEADELEVEDSQEAHDNLINEDLLGTGNGGVAAVVKNLESALSTRRSNHRRTNSFDDLHSGPIKLPLPTSTATTAGTLRSFRKSHASSASLGATTGAALAAATAAAAANGKFVDPSVAVAAVAAAAAAAAAAADQQQFGGSHTQHQQSVSTGNGISRTFGKLGPFLRRNRSSKGTEHLQREALRKSNETAAGLGIDQSQRYIKLPTSSAVTSGAGTGCSPASSPTTASAKSSSSLSSTRSTPQSHSKCSSLTKSATSVAIAASCDSQQQQQQQQKQQQSPSVTSCELSLATGLHSACRSDPTAHRVFHRQRHHSPASSSSSSSSVSSSTSSPPAPTLVPRSANNPPPRPKTSKPSRGGGSSNDTIATVVSSTAATANNNTTATTTTTTTANTSSCSRNSSLPARPSSTVAGVLSASAAVSLDQLLSGLTAVNIFSPICSQLSSTATNSATMTTAMLTSSVPSSSDSTTSMATTTTSGHAQCTGSGGSSSGQQSQQQQQQQQQSQQSQQQQQQQSTSSSSSSSSNHHHHQHQQFINKPPRGWLHPDHKLSDSVGVTYAVRYIGCLGVNTSMKSLDFDTRSLIAKECINRVCEAAGLKTADKKRRTEKRIARMLADAPNMENAGVDVNLSITSAHLNLIVAESGEHLAKHEMPNISFASGGDTDTLDFAAYVAKDNRFGRACFVLECGGGRAQDVITTIGQAFELRFKEFLKRTPRALTDRLDGTHFNGSGSALAAHSQAPPPRADDREYYNDLPGKIPPDIVPALPASAAPASVPHAAPRKKNGLLDQVNLIDLTDDHQTVAVNGTSGDANTVTASQLKTPLAHDPQYVNCTMAPQEEPKDSFDMQPFTSALADDVNVAATTTTATTTSTSTTSKGRSQPVGAPAGSVSIAEVEYVANCELDKEDWFHGPIPRKQSEELVIRDGDFLVRESKGSSGSGEQYVLTGMQSGTHKHLLLVDPEGVVRTKDKTFESVSHLINYHRNNGLPIISSESALILKNPIVAPKLSTLKTN